MGCKIQGTAAGRVLAKAPKIKINGGFFETDDFIKRFGDWTKEGEIEYKLGGRTNSDGSPYIHINEAKDQAFYMLPSGRRVPIFKQKFDSIPEEDRSEVSYAANDAVMYEINLEIGFSNENFEEALGTKPLDELYDEIVEDLVEEGLPSITESTLKNDKEDHITLIKQRLAGLGIRYKEEILKKDDTLSKEHSEENKENDELNEDNQVTDDEGVATEMDDENFSVVKIASYQKAPSTSSTVEVKFLLEFVEEIKNGTSIMSPYSPSTPRLLDSSVVFATLLETISSMPAILEDNDGYLEVKNGGEDVANMIDQVLVKMESYKTKYPWMHALAQKLRVSSEMTQIQFMVTFQNNKNTIITSEINPKTGKYKTLDTSNSGKDTRFVLTDWHDSIIYKIWGNDVAKNKSNGDTFKTLSVDTLEKLTEYAQDRGNLTLSDEEHIKKLTGVVGPLFDFLDMNISEEVVANYLHSSRKADENVNPGVIISSMVNSLQTVVRALKNISNSSKEADASRFIEGNRKALYAIANSYIEVYTPIADHMATVGKKRIYLYSAPTVLQRQIEEWVEDPNLIAKIREEVPSLRNSIWLKNFEEKEGELLKFRVALRGVLQQTGKATDGHDSGDIKKGDYLKVSIYNVLKMQGNNHDPLYSTQIPADKNREYLLNPGGSSFKKITSEGQAYDDVFKGYIIDEMAKMLEASEQIQEAIRDTTKDGVEDLEAASQRLVIGYHLDNDGNIFDNKGQYGGRAFKFGIFRGLEDLEALRKTMIYIKSGKADMTFLTHINNIFSGKAIKDKDGNVVNINEAVKEEVTNRLGTMFSQHVDYLADLGIEYTTDTEDPAYNSIDRSIKERYEEEYGDKAYKGIIMDYVVNDMIAKIEYSKLFTGVLQYYNSDANYIKRVPETYIDGKPLITGLTSGDINYNMIIFSTEKIKNSPLLSNLLSTSIDENGKKTKLKTNTPVLPESIRSYYQSIDRTDAQGWITPARWEFILRRTGKLNKANKGLLQKLKNQWGAISKGEDIATEDAFTAADAKILSAQPLKGVYFKNDLVHGPQYVKYSQAVLIPSMTVNNPKMAALLKSMVDNNVDEAVADTGVKVGIRKPINLITQDGAGNFVVDISKDNISVMDNRSWRLQQDLPTKTIKDNKIGTQIQKIIVSGLRNMPSDKVIIDGYTGPQLADAIDNSLGALSNLGVEKFMKDYGITSNFEIPFLEKLYKPLLADIAKEGVPFENLEKALKGEVDLASMPQLQSIVMANFMGSLKRAATNLMSSGGGLIQVSDHLIGISEIKNNSGIKLLVNSFDRLKPPTVVMRNGRKVVIPGQAFIPHKMIAKLVPNYRELSIKDLNKILKEDELVKRLIGYRIPTQSRASTDLFEIVGILPPEMGDAIITYGEITAKTGSDFDIDKMYFMVPELELVNGKVKRVTKGEKGLRNEVFGLFEKALLAPDLYNDMMTSIDNPTTENQVNALIRNSGGNYNVFTPIAAAETRFNLKAGQSGIGDMVNANNDHTRSQGKGITMNIGQGGWGNPQMDMQYSEMLDINDKDVLAVYEDMDEVLREEFYKKPWNEGKEYTPLDIDSFTSRQITDVLSELTNAFVDIANKDAFITRANWGAVFNSYGTMLIRNGIHPIKVFSMIRNPIFTKMLREISANEGILDGKSSFKIREELLNEYESKYLSLGQNKKETDPTSLEGIKLGQLNINSIYKQGVSQSMESLEEVRNSYLLLKHFNEMLKTTKRYANAITTAKVGETGIKSTVGDYITLINKNSDAFELDGEYGITGLREKYFDTEGNETLLMTFHNNTVGVFDKIIANNPKMFAAITKSNINMMNAVYSSSNIQDFITSAYKATQIIESSNTFFLSGFKPFAKEYTKAEISTLIDRFYKLRKLDDFPLAAKLLIENQEDGSAYFYMNRADNLSAHQKNKIVNNWSKLLREDKELGEFLINRSFRQSGFQYKRDGFHQFIPTEWMLDNGLPEYVKDEMPRGTDMMFYSQLAANAVGQEIFNTRSKFSGTSFKGVFTTEDNIGKFKKGKGEGLTKFPLFTRNVNKDLFKLIGMEIKEVVSTTGDSKKTISGLYSIVPKVKEKEVYYSTDINKFYDKFGTTTNFAYINDIETNMKRKEVIGNTVIKRNFIPLHIDNYLQDKNPIRDLVSELEVAKEKVDIKRNMRNLNEC